ncbi:MAG: patatin-like phospholipase family protein [Deltaproteobacteria bacterium]|nr:patatin-like phospholipase family protein [Deltaproteobacteria bacterium]
MWGCASFKKRTPLPQDLSPVAQVPGISDVRMWGDEPPAYTAEWMRMTKAELKARYQAIYRTSHNYLALSGGGGDGAFGAGLLVGWTAKGDRPEFSLVTGVSTGALIAPFAFLGPDYDAKLKEVYTTSSTEDIIKKLPFFKIRSAAAVHSPEPLRKMLAKYVDQETMEAIAAEYRKGRRLMIGTTNLDAGRPVIWNIGEIAASGDPNALDLIHDLLVASASIPCAFPPVFIEVEVEGSRYDEMHVDGGAASQVFLFPTGLDFSQIMEKLEVKGTARAYIIRNDRLVTDWQAVKPKLAFIAGRSISSLISNNGYGDLYRLYLEAQQAGIEYNLAYIPSEFNEKSKEPFDQEYMGKLFDLGYQMALSGYPWEKTPPGF